jgi:hypothetical protein
MLDELCQDYHCERKYAIKLLGGTSCRRPADAGRPALNRSMRPIEPSMHTIWLAAEQPCGKRLAPAQALWLPHYERHHERLTSRQRQLLQRVSSAALDRLLASARAAHPLRGLNGTKPGSLWRTEIPIRTDHWDLTQPGLLEADSVAHYGGSLAGDFIWSAIFTDICTPGPRAGLWGNRDQRGGDRSGECGSGLAI